ncbi:MAG: MogA/MoaB family molybdenum cofactor biosynthesis protein [Halodesulfurarchaeum sp.]
MVDFQHRDTHRDESGTSEPEEETAEEHDHHAHDVASVGAAVVTVSTSRSLEDDPSGDAIRDAMEAQGHRVVTREVIRDDRDRIQATVNQLVDRRDVDVVVTTGGTGVTPDDVTVEAVGPLFDKHLPGFGELFRRRSAESVGTKVIATRATAGVVDGVLVFLLPGSVDAVELGTEELILPEVGHLAGLVRRDS